MKDKNRVTLMFFTAVDGQKVPLSFMGKSKNPNFLRPLRDIWKYMPIAYNHHKNSLFDIDVSVYFMEFLCSSLLWTLTLFLYKNLLCNSNLGYGLVD